MSLVVGTSRCDVPARAERAEHVWNEVRFHLLRRCTRRWTPQRGVPTKNKGQDAPISVRFRAFLIVFKGEFSIKRLLSGLQFGFIPAVPDKPLMEKRRRMRIFYSGQVQGVGFRYTVKSVAAGFEVTGTVRNLDDGRVELIAEGRRSELEAFQTAIRDSGLAGFIRDENVTWTDAQDDIRGFEITV